MTPAQFWQIEQQNQQNQRANMQQMTNQALGALGQFAEMYEGQKQQKNMLKGMDSAVGAMADVGALPKGFINDYNQLDDATRPFIFQAIASPMFQAFQKKQGYKDYAEVMRGLYGRGGGGGGAPAAGSDFFEF
jgi:hypothetical protein